MTFALAALLHPLLERRRLQRDARQLLTLDDRMLSDIGLDRPQAEAMAASRFGTVSDLPRATPGAHGAAIRPAFA